MIEVSIQESVTAAGPDVASENRIQVIESLPFLGPLQLDVYYWPEAEELTPNSS
jgi:hypothetical protein